MAVTVLIRQRGDAPQGSATPDCHSPASADLRLTLDAPRIVIGRSKSCDIQLPDPSVSKRHASIRLQGGRNLVMDEGSENGVVVMTPGDSAGASVRLPPHTPRALTDGDLIRVGRVWLEVSFCAGVPSTSADVSAVAASVLRHALEEDGESVAARLEQDGTTVLELSDDRAEHVVGRAKDCALVLVDANASRRHAVVLHAGGRWVLRDLGSKRGTKLDDVDVARGDAPLSEGSKVCIGDTTLVFRDPMKGALAAMREADDVKLPASMLPAAPPGMTIGRAVEAPTEGTAPDSEEGELDFDDEDHDDDEDIYLPSTMDRLAVEPRGAGFAAVDAFVILIALSVLGASVLGLAYVLG